MSRLFGVWAAVWVHEICHGLPSLFLIGRWGFGEGESGIPIALPIGGLFIPNPVSWKKYFVSSPVLGIGMLTLTLFSPYFIHAPAYLYFRYRHIHFNFMNYHSPRFIDRLLFRRGQIISSDGGFWNGFWNVLAFPGKGILIDLTQGGIWLIIFILFLSFRIIQYLAEN